MVKLLTPPPKHLRVAGPVRPLGHIVRFASSDGSEQRVLEPPAAPRRFHSVAGEGRQRAERERSAHLSGPSAPAGRSLTALAKKDAASLHEKVAAKKNELSARVAADAKRLAPVKVSGRLSDLHEAAHAAASGESHGAEHVQTLNYAEFREPGAGRRYLITSAETRLTSSAKWRHFVMDDAGQFFCGLEFKALDEIMSKDQYGYAKRSHMFEPNIRHELAKASVFNKAMHVHKLLYTEDQRYIALMTNLPEESSFLLANLPATCFAGGLIKLLEEVSERVSQDFHDKGWLHGDLKLENFMLTPLRRFVVIDYESASPTDATGLADIQGCTWAAPEAQSPKSRADAVARVGPPADVYALGVSLLHAVASRAEAARVAQLPAAERAEALRLSDANLKGALGYLPSDLFEGLRNKILAGAENLYEHADEEAYRFVIEPFAEQAPALLRLVLGSMIQRDPSARASMAQVNAAAQQLAIDQAQQVIAAERAMAKSIDSAMSAYVEPLLRQAATQQFAPVPVQ